MSQFPLIFKISHISELLEYIETIHKRSLKDIALRRRMRGTFSQFNLMCDYMWYFHRDEYN